MWKIIPLIIFDNDKRGEKIKRLTKEIETLKSKAIENSFKSDTKSNNDIEKILNDMSDEVMSLKKELSILKKQVKQRDETSFDITDEVTEECNEPVYKSVKLVTEAPSLFSYDFTVSKINEVKRIADCDCIIVTTQYISHNMYTVAKLKAKKLNCDFIHYNGKSKNGLKFN